MPINIKKIPGFLRRHAAAIGAVAIFSVISLLLSILLTPVCQAHDKKIYNFF